MLQSARYKLTLWYVVISMIISLLFSFAIFYILDANIERGFRRVELRFQRPSSDSMGPMFIPPSQDRLTIYREEMGLAERQLRLNLIYINLLILGVSAVAGYLLAGKTLKPIRSMMDDQNRFVTDASHEFRTPLTALKTSIEVSLRDKNLDLIEAKQILKNNLEDVNNLKRLSDSLLNLSQTQSFNNSLNFENLSLNEVINKSVSMMSNLSKEKEINIEVDAKECDVFGDREKLIEFFIIFLDNAIKYSPSKSIIKISSVLKVQYCLIEIKDNGIGIDKNDLPHIFDRFYRYDKSRTKSAEHGYGLGLSIAKHILQLHKGSINVSSKIKEGTTFTIKLPTI